MLYNYRIKLKQNGGNMILDSKGKKILGADGKKIYDRELNFVETESANFVAVHIEGAPDEEGVYMDLEDVKKAGMTKEQAFEQCRLTLAKSFEHLADPI